MRLEREQVLLPISLALAYVLVACGSDSKPPVALDPRSDGQVYATVDPRAAADVGGVVNGIGKNELTGPVPDPWKCAKALVRDNPQAFAGPIEDGLPPPKLRKKKLQSASRAEGS